LHKLYKKLTSVLKDKNGKSMDILSIIRFENNFK